ncbi:MAG: hypothetical protein K2O45_17500 [Oscillospiraceae bacterium]|nr:hypothetical protein [Oscillospiraceae bacterium]
MTIGMLARFGEWLRELSLSGGGGNAAAWGIVLGLTALPALGLLWRGRRKADWLLLLAAGEILAGLFYLVNPTQLVSEYDARAFIGLAAAGCVGSTMLAWAVLRGLKNILEAERPGRTMERLLRWSSWALAWLAVLVQGIGLWQKILGVAEGNTALGTGALMPTYLVLGVLAVMDLIPTLLCCQVLRWGGKLGLRMEEAPFGGETAALAEEMSGQCARMAALSVGICVAGNLLQFFLLPVLHSVRYNVSFPFASVLLAAVLGLLCRYFRRAKEVSDDNESII